MIVHTFGPKSTDSSEAANWYANQHVDCTIQLHDNFLQILRYLTDYAGDLVLLPMAFQDPQGNSLGDYHYRLYKKMKLVDTFLTDLNPIVVLENQSPYHKLYTHPATREIAKRYQNNYEIVLCDSKANAYRNYQKDGKIVITNEKSIKNLGLQERILEKINSKMCWCVYQIGGKNT